MRKKKIKERRVRIINIKQAKQYWLSSESYFGVGWIFLLVALFSFSFVILIILTSFYWWFVVYHSKYLVSRICMVLVHCHVEIAPSPMGMSHVLHVNICTLIWRASNMHKLAMVNGNLILVLNNIGNIKIMCTILESNISCYAWFEAITSERITHNQNQKWYWQWRMEMNQNRPMLRNSFTSMFSSLKYPLWNNLVKEWLLAKVNK